MNAGPLDPRLDPDRFRADEEDPSIVPGLEPTGRTLPLDRSQDPDRFAAQAPPDGPLPAAGQGQSLTDLLGASRTYEGERDNYQWAVGLLTVFAFLALVTVLFTFVLTP